MKGRTEAGPGVLGPARRNVVLVPGRALVLVNVLLLVLGAAPAQAQRPAYPLTTGFASMQDTILVVSADASMARGPVETGRLVALGAEASLGGLRWRAQAGGAALFPERDGFTTGWSVGASLSRELSATPPSPIPDLRLMAGVGYARMPVRGTGAITRLELPLALQVIASAPIKCGGLGDCLIEAWAQPDLRLRRQRSDAFPVDYSATRLGGGSSAGLSYTSSAHRVGVELAGDLLGIRGAPTGGWRLEWAAALRARWVPPLHRSRRSS